MADMAATENKSKFHKRLKSLRKDVDDRHAYWEQDLAPGPMRDRFLRDAYTPVAKFLTVVEEKFLPIVDAGKTEEARRILREQLSPEYEQLRAAIDEVATLANHITKTLGSRLQRASEFATAITQGTMSTTIEEGPADEIGRLLRALAEMRDHMRDMVGGIRTGVETLVGTAVQLSTVSKQTIANVEEIKRRASVVVQQAETSCQHTDGIASGISVSSRNLESVASTTQEMSSTVDGIANDSAKARAISDEAQAQAAHAVMIDLENAAKRIGQVSETIRSISAQTSLATSGAPLPVFTRPRNASTNPRRYPARSPAK